MADKLAYRHAQSPLNLFQEISSGGQDHPAWGNLSAGITNTGARQSEDATRLLVARYGIEILDQRVAVSQYRRTQETAKAMGFKKLIIRPVLNEVLREDMNRTVRQAARNILPQEAIDAAQEIWDNMPPEDIWISHGLTLAGLRWCTRYNCRRWVPRNCELTKISF